MTAIEKLQAQASVIESYAKVMRSKGMAARAAWAFHEVRKLEARIAGFAVERVALAA